MWYTPETRFRVLIVRRPADGAVVATSLLDAEKFAAADALEDAVGKETVRLFEQHGQNLEVFESSCGGPRPLLGEWWRGRPKLRFLIVRRKAGKHDMPVRKFMDAAKYRNDEQFGKAVSEEKARLAEKYPVAEWDVLEVAALSMAEFKEKNPELAK
ncbi:MAG: hypothetical protein K8T20_10390 [Planctomycetes bacterium]|nr:hypothetical protein [Planctomycetota bacterium]